MTCFFKNISRLKTVISFFSKFFFFSFFFFYNIIHVNCFENHRKHTLDLFVLYIVNSGRCNSVGEHTDLFSKDLLMAKKASFLILCHYLLKHNLCGLVENACIHCEKFINRVVKKDNTNWFVSSKISQNGERK